MHKLNTVLLLAYIPFFGLCQNNTVTGNIVDELGLPIYRASIEIDQTKDITYTDYEGAFLLASTKNFHWKVNIKSKGYKSESFFVLSSGKLENLVLEYNAEMQSILGKKVGLIQKFYWEPASYKFNLFSKKNRNLGVVLNN